MFALRSLTHYALKTHGRATSERHFLLDAGFRARTPTLMHGGWLRRMLADCSTLVAVSSASPDFTSAGTGTPHRLVRTSCSACLELPPRADNVTPRLIVTVKSTRPRRSTIFWRAGEASETRRYATRQGNGALRVLKSPSPARDSGREQGRGEVGSGSFRTASRCVRRNTNNHTLCFSWNFLYACRSSLSATWLSSVLSST